jgi:hypothetical protein
MQSVRTLGRRVEAPILDRVKSRVELSSFVANHALHVEATL